MLWIFSPSRRYLVINAIVGNNQMNEIKFTDPFLCVIFHTGEKFQRKVGKQRFITWYFWISNCRKNEVNICGSEKKMMQWRHCTDALQMQRWVHRPSVPSPRAPAASDVIVRPPSHPGFHENNDVTVSGPWIHLDSRSVNQYSRILSNEPVTRRLLRRNKWTVK